MQAQAREDYFKIKFMIKDRINMSKTMIEIKDTAIIEYIEEFAKYLDVIVEDGRIFVDSIYNRKDGN